MIRRRKIVKRRRDPNEWVEYKRVLQATARGAFGSLREFFQAVMEGDVKAMDRAYNEVIADMYSANYDASRAGRSSSSYIKTSGAPRGWR